MSESGKNEPDIQPVTNIKDKKTPFKEIQESLYLVQVPSKGSYVCECARGSDCGEDCLNRMLKVECCKKCPAGKTCTNRQFQRAKYPTSEAFLTKHKGWGLRALEPIKSGGFIYEYCGEIYDGEEFERRQLEYELSGLKHFYFMTLASNLFIDATRKGNRSRFINHSCSPNAQTEKWTVGGQVRIGFFAIRDIEANEEITFDYKYQRYGDVAQPCYCGSSNCRGVLGVKKENRRSSSEGATEVTPGNNKKRRKVNLSNAVRELKDRLQSWVDGDEGLVGVQVVAEFVQSMISDTPDEGRRLMLETIQNSSKTVQERFLFLQGLSVLKNWMVAAIDSQEALFIREILTLLESLPIDSRNRIDKAGILPVLDKIMEGNDEFAKETVSIIQKKWKDLKQVFVTQRNVNTCVQTITIPADQSALFTKSEIKELEAELMLPLDTTLNLDNTLTIKIVGEKELVEKAAELIPIFASERQKMELEEDPEDSHKQHNYVKHEVVSIDEEVVQKILEGNNAHSMNQDIVEVQDVVDPNAILLLDPDHPAMLHHEYTETRDPFGRIVFRHDASGTILDRKPVTRQALHQFELNLHKQEKLRKQSERDKEIEAMTKKRLSESSNRSSADSDKNMIVSEFKQQVAKVIRKILRKHREKGVKYGYIESEDDFRHLCRKMTKHIYEKELKRRVDDPMQLKFNKSVDEKTRGYVREFLKGSGKVYRRRSQDTLLDV